MGVITLNNIRYVKDIVVAGYEKYQAEFDSIDAHDLEEKKEYLKKI